MNRNKDWTADQIQYYLEGIKYSDYPSVFWRYMQPLIEGYQTFLDVGSGPGAFALKALEEGFLVQAVDSSRKSLEALEYQAGTQNKNRLKTICGNWPDVDADQCDTAVCAYSFGGSIGTEQGIAKIFDLTRSSVFFITPVDKIQTDFLSEKLYQLEGLNPPLFKGNYKDLTGILDKFQIDYDLEILSYDFGFPLRKLSAIDDCALFLTEKLGLVSYTLVKEHLNKIITERNRLLWVPNPRRSALITCSGSEK
jgi:SAM-dependent methyltransferase